MTAICAACQDARADFGLLCSDCGNRTLTHLRQIEHLYLALSVIPITGGGERRAPGFGSRSPARDDVIVQQDPRSKGDDNGPAAVSAILSWTRLVAYEREVEQPETVTMTGELEWLRTHHSWICAQPWIDDYCRELREIRDRLRGLVGLSPERSVGACMGVDCDGKVYPTADASGVQCGTCRRRYTGLDLVRFSVQQEAS